MLVNVPSWVAFRYSVKKYLYELAEVENIAIVFDRSLSTPNLRNGTVDKWIVPVYGLVRYSNTAVQTALTLNICTRKDPEWEKNAAVLEYFKNHLESAYYDGTSPIPFYVNGEQSGVISVRSIEIQKAYDFEDQTKVTPMDIQLWCPIAYQ